MESIIRGALAAMSVNGRLATGWWDENWIVVPSHTGNWVAFNTRCKT